MPKTRWRQNIPKTRKRIIALLGELEDRLIAAGYAFDGVRTSPVPTVFETLLEALRLDGYDIDPIEFGDSDSADTARKAKPVPVQHRKPPRHLRRGGGRAVLSINASGTDG